MGIEPRAVVLSLFDYSTVMVEPWAEAGYLCYCVDIRHPAGETRKGNIIRVGTDILEYLPPLVRYEAVFAFPPCTHVAVSGARWFRGKGLGKLADSIRLFHRTAEICEWSGAPYLIENPVSTVSTYWRKPDHMFDPCDYGDPWTKRTCLWSGGGFVMPAKRRVSASEGSKMHRIARGPERATIRSETPKGFAKAVFRVNNDRQTSNQ